MVLNCPAFALPLALVFWGWRADAALVAGALLAVTALAARLPWRWRLEAAQFYRVGDLTSVLFLGVVAYGLVAGVEAPPVYIILRWLPAFFAPLLLAQLYSAGGLLPLGALFYSMRRAGGDSSRRIDFRLPYALLCVLAAGVGQADDPAYFYAAALYTSGLLWRSRAGWPAPAWLLAFALAALAGYGGQVGLTRLQAMVEEWAVDWLSGRAFDPDPFKARTAIGDLGRLKLSSAILMRVRADRLLDAPLLLKEAAYDNYRGQNWIAGQASFAPFVPPNGDGPRSLDVARVQARRDVLIPAPNGLRGLILSPPGGTLKANRLGAIEWPEAPPVLRYRMTYDPAARDPAPPAPQDLELPKQAAELLAPLVDALGLRGLPPAQAVERIAKFFSENFAYSLYLGEAGDSREALADFLYRRRAGHCEYFATATALLLRAAGVPARFVVGYSMNEYSPAEKLYLVRQRHAHAWAEAYIDGAWRTADNTPAVWAEQEAETDPWWRPLADAGSRWLEAFQIWRWERAQAPEEEGTPQWAWLVVPLGLWLAWRLYRGRQTAQTPAGRASLGATVSPDARYRRLEENLARAGHPPRLPSEPPLQWLRRIGREDCRTEVLAFYRRRYGGSHG
jgi:transglutaminase-like putative cysteine protease